jgi:hypothetical protein
MPSSRSARYAAPEGAGCSGSSLAIGTGQTGEKTTVAGSREPRKLRTIVLLAALFESAAILAGCGRTSEVTEIPEAARKALVQRKVEVQGRAAQSSNVGRRAAKGHAPAR